MQVILQRNYTTVVGFDSEVYPHFKALSDQLEGRWKSTATGLKFLVEEPLDFEITPGVIISIKIGDEFHVTLK